MLENKLFLIVGFQDHGVSVEALNPARQLYSAEQVNRRDGLLLAHAVQEEVLDILVWLFHRNYLLVVMSANSDSAPARFRNPATLALAQACN